MTQRDPLRYMTIAAAAKACGVSTQRIRHWIATGRLDSYDSYGLKIVKLSAVSKVAATPPTRGRPRKINPTKKKGGVT